MKQCLGCHTQVEDTVNFCPECGSGEFEPLTEEVPASPASAPRQEPVSEPVPVPVPKPDLGNGNITAGVVGAFLFALAGGLLYFVIYQFGFIASICGLVMFILANFGYHLFAKGNKDTKIGIITSIIVTVVMIFLAEFFCISYDIFTVFKEDGITFFDAVRATPAFLTDPDMSDLRAAVVKDLLLAYALALIGSLRTIVSTFQKKSS